jgi:hypothetical protein
MSRRLPCVDATWAPAPGEFQVIISPGSRDLPRAGFDLPGR